MRTVPGRTDRVVVVGAGLGGLSAALHLAGAGRQVTVLEQAAQPGGLAAGFTERSGAGQYRFDSGPTVLTMPELIDAAFAAVGESSPVALIRLDPAYEARFADGSVLAVRTDTEAMAAEIEAGCGSRDAAGYRRLVRRLRELYECEAPAFIDRNLDSPRDLSARAVLRLIRLGGLRRWSEFVAAYVEDDRLRRIFSFQALYAGLAPQRALATYAVIAYMDCVAGVFYPRGGMAAVPQAMAAAAQRHGVQFRYRTRVSELTVEHARMSGVITTDGERIPADVVVWNGDAGAARMVLGRRVGRRGFSPSCVVWHAGTPRSPVTAHHTISFGNAWERTFDEIIRRGRPMSDPSLLISAPTRTDPALAPAGRHVHYALFPTPNLTAGLPGWLDGYQERMWRTLRSRGLADCVADADTERLSTPTDWAAAGLPAGTPFGPHHGVRQTGPLRQPTLDRNLPNLVYCGASTQPGVGVPSVLVSGRLAAERITG